MFCMLARVCTSSQISEADAVVNTYSSHPAVVGAILDQIHTSLKTGSC